MSEQDGFDARLAAHFEREHRQVPPDAFVATTMQKVRAARRRGEVMRTGMRVAALVAAAVASPWLIDGVARLNAALESSFTWTLGLPASWVLGALVALVVLVRRARSR